VLKWARANGCPWDEKTREYAAWKGYVERPPDDVSVRQSLERMLASPRVAGDYFTGLKGYRAN
jgi:hypothetical protein